MTDKDAAKKVADTAAKAEETLDNIAEKVSNKMGEVVPEGAKNKAKELAAKADNLASKVDDASERLDDIADAIIPNDSGSDVDLVTDWNESISRLFIFRFLWLFIEIWVIYVWSIWMLLIYIVHFFYMLILGKRNRNLRNRTVRYQRHMLKWGMYLYGIIDKRPDLIED